MENNIGLQHKSYGNKSEMGFFTVGLKKNTNSIFIPDVENRQNYFWL